MAVPYWRDFTTDDIGGESRLPDAQLEALATAPMHESKARFVLPGEGIHQN
jgi:hypothetical protein